MEEKERKYISEMASLNEAKTRDRGLREENSRLKRKLFEFEKQIMELEGKTTTTHITERKSKEG